jgi:outer membrane receptor protein involved in Fe transport
VDAQADVESYAAFFHVNYRLSEALQVTGGLRYTHESKHATFEQVSTMVPVLINIPRFSDDRSDDDISPKLALSYFTDDHTMFYVTAA